MPPRPGLGRYEPQRSGARADCRTPQCGFVDQPTFGPFFGNAGFRAVPQRAATASSPISKASTREVRAQSRYDLDSISVSAHTGRSVGRIVAEARGDQTTQQEIVATGRSNHNANSQSAAKISLPVI